MTQPEIVERLRSVFGDAIGAWREMAQGGAYQRRMGSYLEITDANNIRELGFYLRDEPSLAFDHLLLISSLDNGDGTLSVVYHLESMRHNYQLAIKATVSAEDAR